MARLIINEHPNRVFKDDWWDGWNGDATVDGYRSTGDIGDIPVRFGNLWAFAVPLADDSEEGGRHAVEMFDRILDLEAPFVAAEVVRLSNGQRCAIGFYPEPA